MMPNVGGAEALRRIKTATPEMPVLGGGARRDLDDSDGWDLADGHLTNPIDFGELLARIELLTGARPRPGSRSP